MIWLKQSTARTLVIGPFLDSTDGVTPETGLTISQADIRLSKNGGAFAQTNNATGATHMENGYYSVPLDATDTNTLGVLRVAVAESGALPVWQDLMVVPANVWDSMFGADLLDVSMVQIAGSAVDAAAAQLGVNVVNWKGAAAAAMTGDAYARLGAPAGASVSADIAAVKSDTGSTLTAVDTEVAAILAAVDTEVAAIKAKTDNLPAAPAATGDIPSAATIADAVWDEAVADHAGVGSTGAALAAAGGSGDPWSTALPGAYGAGTAGKIVGDYLNAPVGTIDTVVDAIKAKTDNLPASPAAIGSAMTLAAGAVTAAAIATDAIDADALAADAATEIADALLKRDMSAVSGEAARSPLNALRALRNKAAISGSTLTVYKEDDSTSAWTAAVATDAAADPITSVDPA